MEGKKVKPHKEESGVIITFSNNEYLKWFDQDHDNLMVIMAAIHNYVAKRILVDQGSLVNILYNVMVASINIRKFDLRPHDGNLIGFFGKQVPIEGSIKLRVTLGTWMIVIDMDVDFLIIDALIMAYNTIMGRTSLDKI